MGQPVVLQPNGQFAIFSTERDTFVAWNRSREYVLSYFETYAAERERENITRLLDRLEAGEDPYGHLAYTWEEMLKFDRRGGGNAWKELQSLDSSPPAPISDPGAYLPLIHASNAIGHPLIRRAIAERNRQLREKGFNPLHDAAHANGELGRAAAAYITGSMAAYPWPDATKVAWKHPSERLIRAVALLLAEWDRLAAEEQQRNLAQESQIPVPSPSTENPPEERS